MLGHHQGSQNVVVIVPAYIHRKVWGVDLNIDKPEVYLHLGPRAAIRGILKDGVPTPIYINNRHFLENLDGVVFHIASHSSSFGASELYTVG